MLLWLEDAVQFRAPTLLKFTATCCGLLTPELLAPKFKTLRLSDKAGVTIVVGSEKFAVADPPPDTLTWFTCGDVAVCSTFTLTVITGYLEPGDNASLRVHVLPEQFQS